MKDIKAFLFDMDGVITDTETQYDNFLEKLGKEYNLPDDFAGKTKGKRLFDIIIEHFSHLSEEGQKEVENKVISFELYEMQYITISGAIDFIKTAKKEGIKIAMVTSSLKVKVDVALKSMGLEKTFDALVTADDVKNGKPDPECFLIGAEKLEVKPEECVVFEDSFAGIEAGIKAGANVVGVSTTNTKDALFKHGLVYKIIPDFMNLNVENIIT